MSWAVRQNSLFGPGGEWGLTMTYQENDRFAYVAFFGPHTPGLRHARTPGEVSDTNDAYNTL